jgi:NAD(P)-dependent dehydrogenase (short-subunit alcohol dehydrogenase family)
VDTGALLCISFPLAGRGPYTTHSRGGALYGSTKAALERFTQGLAEEVHAYGIAVTCYSPSQIVATPGTMYHKLHPGFHDPTGESVEYMAKDGGCGRDHPCGRVFMRSSLVTLDVLV